MGILLVIGGVLPLTGEGLAVRNDVIQGMPSPIGVPTLLAILGLFFVIASGTVLLLSLEGQGSLDQNLEFITGGLLLLSAILMVLPTGFILSRLGEITSRPAGFKATATAMIITVDYLSEFFGALTYMAAAALVVGFAGKLESLNLPGRRTVYFGSLLLAAGIVGSVAPVSVFALFAQMWERVLPFQQGPLMATSLIELSLIASKLLQIVASLILLSAHMKSPSLSELKR